MLQYVIVILLHFDIFAAYIFIRTSTEQVCMTETKLLEYYKEYREAGLNPSEAWNKALETLIS